MKSVKKKYLTDFYLCCILCQVMKLDRVLKQVDELIKIVEQSMLYDFYGELLNEHQKKIYEDVVFNDMSLAEIAKEEGISRQGVHDLIKRCDKILRDYEDKLHLVEKFNTTKKDVTNIKELSERFMSSEDKKLIDEIITVTDKILAEI